MPLVLVQNEVTAGGIYDHWKDDEGVQYHFPNQYINKIREGEFFVYYRGARRFNNKRAVPEYFGFGKIGKIWPDPAIDFKQPRKNLRWYCEILDYIPFKKPVPFRIDGTTFEKIPTNLWSVAVRNLSTETFKTILEAASIQVVDSEPLIGNSSKILPDVNEVKPVIVSSDQSVLIKTTLTQDNNKKDEGFGSKFNRYSKYAKLYGDRSEEIVYKVLLQNRVYSLRWVAQQKEKPGWDIEYKENDNLIAVEVKGTSGKWFSSIEVTAGEWNAAKRKSADYYLYLVSDCLSTSPRIQVIKNPYSLYLSKQITITPLLYRLTANK